MNTPHPAQARAHELTSCAHSLLVDLLEKKGNQVSKLHSLALWQLLSGFTEQGLRIRSGRCAYALPCGAGKTLSVIAWIAAQYRLGLRLSLAVTAQQIESLLAIKDHLIALGVPTHCIGIRHSAGTDARWPDTGDADCLIMLGTHARIHGSAEPPAFCRYEGGPRDLLIWDESLMSSDAVVLEEKMARTALRHFASPSKPLLLRVADSLEQTVSKERQAQKEHGQANDLALLSVAESDAALTELGSPYCRGAGERALLDNARATLKLLRHPISLLDVGAGDTGLGLMRYRVMVASELKNIAVLDASYAVRELCKADRTIDNRTTDAMRNFKNYSNVTVRQSRVPSGRCQFQGDADTNLAIANAVESIRGISPGESILVFTFKDDSAIRKVKAALNDAGVDLDHELADGRQRIQFSTWGKHTTDNSFSDCEHVVLIGVLRMAPLVLAASMAGQKDDRLYRMTRQELKDVEMSELASNILQAANRGRCRRVDEDGYALPMTIHLITKEDELRPILEQAMPGLQWETVNVREPSNTEALALRIIDYLVGLPADTPGITKAALFKAVDCRMAKDAKAEAMRNALWAITARAGGNPNLRWDVRGRSLVRGAVM